ncbi:MAG: PilZ domain-containing protein [Bacillota bacterium]
MESNGKRVFIGLPRPGEQVLVAAPPGAVWCAVLAYDGALLLKPRSPLRVAPGDEVVVRRQRAGQEFFFRERVVEGQPLAVSLSVASVTRAPRHRVSAPVRVLLAGGVLLDGAAQDLSQGGARVALWRPVPEGAEAVLQLEGREARCEVRSCFPWAGGWWYAGLAFRERESDFAEAVGRLVARGSPGKKRERG